VHIHCWVWTGRLGLEAAARRLRQHDHLKHDHLNHNEYDHLKHHHNKHHPRAVFLHALQASVYACYHDHWQPVW
jgi:hypothetical protein